MSPPDEHVLVRTASGSYPVRVGEGLLGSSGASIGSNAPVLVVTDSNVGPLYLDALLPSLPGGSGTVTVPAGEASKTLATVRSLYRALLDLEADRETRVVALGGGVVSDLAGFAASTFLRGLPWVAFPTTVLAMVDASVGGKTGVNLEEGKNLVGAFHQPSAVVADLRTLLTLPEREARSGLAEMVKTGLALDAGLFADLEAGAGATAGTVLACVEAKAGVVREDEREAGRRRVLNLGHTAGHAIEAAVGYGGVLHGEAVAVGLVAAARISVGRGLVEPGLTGRLEALLGALGLPSAVADLPAAPEPERVREHLVRDKKRKGEALALALVADVGRAVVVEDGTEEEVLGALFGG